MLCLQENVNFVENEILNVITVLNQGENINFIEKEEKNENSILLTIYDNMKVNRYLNIQTSNHIRGIKKILLRHIQIALAKLYIIIYPKNQ